MPLTAALPSDAVHHVAPRVVPSRVASGLFLIYEIRGFTCTLVACEARAPYGRRVPRDTTRTGRSFPFGCIYGKPTHWPHLLPLSAAADDGLLPSQANLGGLVSTPRRCSPVFGKPCAACVGSDAHRPLSIRHHCHPAFPPVSSLDKVERSHNLPYFRSFSTPPRLPCPASKRRSIRHRRARNSWGSLY